MAGVAKGSRVSKGSDNLPGKSQLVKVKLSVDRETARLIRLEAFGRDCSLGQVVVDLVRLSPRRFVLTDRGAKGAGGSSAPESPGSSEAPGHVGPARPLGLLSDSA